MIKNEDPFNSLGPFTNGNEVIFVNEADHVITKLSGVFSDWTKKIRDYVWSVVLDEKNIYVKTSDELICIDFTGTVNSRLNISGSVLLEDKENLYIQGLYLYKIDKQTKEIIYQVDHKDIGMLFMQNNNYLFSDRGEVIDKETGKKVRRLPSSLMGVSDNFIVYFNDGKLICIKASNFGFVWEREYSEFYTWHPIIEGNLLYVFSERLEILDIQTGEQLWREENEYDLETIEFIFPIISNDKYVVIFIEDGPARIYEKQYYI